MVVNDSTFISVVCRIKTTITKTGNESFHKDCVYMCAHAQSCLTLLWPQGLQPTRLPCPWDFPAKNTGVDCHLLLQGIFPGIETMFLTLEGRSFTTWEAHICVCVCVCVCLCVCVYYSTIEKSEILQFERTWMDLEGIILSEISQTDKHRILYDLTYMWNLKHKQKLVS